MKVMEYIKPELEILDLYIEENILKVSGDEEEGGGVNDNPTTDFD